MNLVVIVFVVACVVVAWKRSAARAGHSKAWPRRIRAMGWGIVPLPIAIVAFVLLGANFWTISAMLAGGIAAVLAPALAADAASAGLVLLGMLGLLLATVAFSQGGLRGPHVVQATSFPILHLRLPPLPPHALRGPSGIVESANGDLWRNVLILAEAAGFLGFGLWLVPRTFGANSWTLRELTRRVQRLAETRTAAVDGAAAELRRVERDLHDGAQARLVAVGMNLRAAERLMLASPQAALALVAEARQTSSRALADLRDLVRGIHPPVLADRGLGDAVRALALDAPVRTNLDIDLPGRPDGPVESAAYFAVAEILANAVKHAGADAVEIRMRHSGDMLRITVTDDGVGGADPAIGTGLRGIERRLDAFDGILAVSSPAGGPTIVVVEVPCVLS
jgi:signal transduction histidine kinase